MYIFISVNVSSLKCLCRNCDLVGSTHESYHDQVTLKAPLLPAATRPKPSTAQKASVKQCCSPVMPSVLPCDFFLLGEVDAKPGPMFFTNVRFPYESYHHQVTLKAPLPLAIPPKPSTAQKASVKQCCSAVLPSPTLIDKNISGKAMPKF